MIRKGFMKSLRCAVVVLALCMVQANAYEEEFDLNALIVRSEMYVWNRITDFLDIFRGGIAGGPGIGFEVALTDYGKLGAYVSYERGVDFPHFLPPLWLIDYYGRRPVFNFHEGYYATASLGPWRKQILDTKPTLYFPRGCEIGTPFFQEKHFPGGMRCGKCLPLHISAHPPEVLPVQNRLSTLVQFGAAGQKGHDG